MAPSMPMVTTGISTLTPASTYPDLMLINNAGQGLNNTPSQVQDGLGNMTNMIISSNYINFDRSVSQFQLDGVALTASAATLNAITDVANGEYLLLNSNVQIMGFLYILELEVPLFRPIPHLFFLVSSN